jgi:hypothetical protein
VGRGVVIGAGLGAVVALVIVVLIRGGLGDPLRSSTAPSAQDERCTWENSRAAEQPPRRRKVSGIKLTPAAGSAQRVVNIDADRDRETLRGIRLQVNKPLPAWFSPEHLEIYADPLIRTGDDKLETVSFPEPVFIPPRLLSGGRRLDFGICLDPSSLPAGRYTGLINIDGPTGVEGATVAISANAKDAAWFWRGAVIAFLAALATLLFKGAADKRLELAEPPTEGEPNPPRPKWREAFAKALGDLQFIFTSLVALGTAFAALYTAYANEPSWGADGVASVFTLVVTAFAAVGGQSLLAGLRQGGTSGT